MNGSVSPASIRDVATLAGVSPGTVSKVLNRQPGIAQATRDRVLAASRSLDYRPNEMVRGIFARRSFAVGLITSDSYGRFSGPIMAGAEAALGTKKLSVYMADTHGDLRREAQQLGAMRGRRIDGLIVTGRCSNVRPSVGHRLPFPVVYAHTPSDDPTDYSVMVDDEEAGRLAAEHLIAMGRRRIGHITGPEDFDAVQRRQRGFEGVLAQHDMRPAGNVLAGFWCESWGREAVHRLLEDAPDIDAVYCGSDLLARGVLDGLREAGRAVPEDVAVVGTDNWRLVALAARPPLTTVDLRLEDVGRRAAEVLLASIDGQAAAGTEMVPPRLVARSSSGAVMDDAEFRTAGSYHESCIHPAHCSD